MKTVSLSLETSYEEVETGTTQLSHMEKTFIEISDEVSEMLGNIRTVLLDLNSIENHSFTMNQSVEDIAAVAEESAAAIEETAASSAQANSSMEEVTTSSTHLVHTAESLNSLINHFNI